MNTINHQLGSMFRELQHIGWDRWMDTLKRADLRSTLKDLTD